METSEQRDLRVFSVLFPCAYASFHEYALGEAEFSLHPFLATVLHW
jgi:hypothetical protein